MRRNRLRRRIDGIIEWVREHVVGWVVDRAVAWRYLTLGVVAMLFLVAVSMFAGGILKFRGFPEIDGDVIEARVILPQGTPLAVTEQVAERITEAVKRVDAHFTPLQPGRKKLVKNIQTLFGQNSDANERGPHLVTVSIDLLTGEERNARIDDILDVWRREVGAVPDVLSLRFDELVIGPGGKAIEIRLRGRDLEELKGASRELQEWLSKFSGVCDLMDDLRPGKPEIRVRLRKGAMVLGLNARNIADQLRTAYFGKTASEIQTRGESYEIDVRVAPEDQDSLMDLDYFYITGADGAQVPLRNAVTFESGRGYACITRVDELRTVTVQGDVNTQVANSGEIISEFRRELQPELEKKYPGVRAFVEGESKRSSETGVSMFRALLFGIVGVFILLSFQFRSYVEPVIVMANIPLAFIGVVFGHLLMGIEFTLPGLMGFISLSGVVVNDSILLVEFIKIRRREGMAIAQASRQASRARFRAVMLTSLTTIAGLLPLLSEKSMQAQILIPLAVSIVFGLLASTLLVLFVVPCLYSILGDLGLAEKIESPAQ